MISKLVVTALLKTRALVALDLPLEKRRFLMLRHKERYVTKAAQEFSRLAAKGG